MKLLKPIMKYVNHKLKHTKMVKFSMLLLVSFVISLLSAFGQTKQELNKRVEECYNKKDYECAEYYTKEILKVEKDKNKKARLYSNLGTFQRRMGKVKEAEKSYETAIKYDSQLITAYTNLATLNEQSGEIDKALANFESALKIDPNDKGAYLNRSVIYERIGKRDLALADIQKVLSLDPKNYAARGNLANIKKRIGKIDEALSDLNDLIAERPEDPILYNNRADTYLRLKKIPEAIADIEKALSLDKLYGTGHVTKGEILLEMGKKDEACIAFNKAIDLGVKKEKISDLMKECN